MNPLPRKPLTVALLSLASLTGCESNKTPIDTDYSELELSKISGESLTKVSQSEFERYLKNGIRLRLSSAHYNGAVQLDTVAESDASLSNGGDSGSNYSTTNLHELGVDEADRIKYDGEYLYIVTNPYGNYITPMPVDDIAEPAVADGAVSQDMLIYHGEESNEIRILRTNTTTAGAEEVYRIESAATEMLFSELYLRTDEKQLVSLSNTHYAAWDATLVDDDWRWSNGKVELKAYDTSSPSNPTKQWKLELEGSLHDSRRIGDKLYLVMRTYPNIAYLEYGATDEGAQERNEDLIANTPIADLLPHYQANDGDIKPLVSAEDCLITSDVSENHGYADIVTLVAVDLDTHAIESVLCLNTNVNGIYSSDTGFYIGGTSLTSWYEYSNLTAVHKFSLNNGDLDYRASASVPGFLGWDDPAFRMDEVDGELRIVTTNYDSVGTPSHRLTILREDAEKQQLKVVSTLPNEEQTAPIGKPGEEIYAVRFLDEQAFIITFERIDPLYVLDLSDSQAPKIAGELEIPGFSRYLHPVENGWLLGIGQEVKDGIQLGLKVELYDVRDATAPRVKDKIVLGGRNSYSEVLHDLRALAYLDREDGNKRFAFPANVWKAETNYTSQWLGSGLFAFELQKDAANEFTLSASGEIIAESPQQHQFGPLHSGVGRSVIHDDAVFYIHGNDVYSNLWGSWHTEQGPM